jgi:hypothetical protein
MQGPTTPQPAGVLVSGLLRPALKSEDEIAANMFQVDRPPDLLAHNDQQLPAAATLASRIVAAEGGPGANPASSAAGYGQFLRGTWLDIFARTYPQLAQKLSADQILALREVKPLALELTGRYAQENALSLRRVGLSATEASLSLAHAVGPGGAINILVSRHDEPAENVLSPEAIAANPFMKQMTTGTLRQWAMNRVQLPAGMPHPKRAAVPLEEELEPLRPSEDFLIDGRTKASQVLAENQKAIAALQNLLEAAFETGAGNRAQFDPSMKEWLNEAGIDPDGLLLGDPIVVTIFHRTAAGLVAATMHRLAARATHREFEPIGRRADEGRGLRPAVVRGLATALIERMRKENRTIIDIVRHRRSAALYANDPRS